MEIVDYTEPTHRVGREASCIAIVGEPGTGKSTISFELMKAAERGLMVLPDFDTWAETCPAIEISSAKSYQYLGIKHHIYNADDDFIYIHKYMHNGMLSLDDARNYIPKNFDNSWFKKILRRKRQHMLDIVFQSHGFMEIPPQIFPFITDFIILPTDSPEPRKKLFKTTEQYNAVYKAVQTVNRLKKTSKHVNRWVKL